MKRDGLMFLLLSGCVLVCHLQPTGVIRSYSLIGSYKNWAAAQQYCREHYDDLATIQSQSQNDLAQYVANDEGIWIGLFQSKWRWSLHSEEFSPETSFSNWSGEPLLMCVTVNNLGLWHAYNCAERFYSMCYNAEHNQHHLISQRFSWSDSQDNCRSGFTDLSSIKSPEDNLKISNLMKSYIATVTNRDSTQDSDQDSTQDGDQDGTQVGDQDGTQVGDQDGAQVGDQDGDGDSEDDSEGDSEDDRNGRTNRETSQLTVWIGLHRYFWLWSNLEEYSFAQWSDNQVTDGMATCVKMDSTGKWFKARCSEEHHFLCHSDHRPLMQRTVKVRLSGGSADLDDPTLQDSILQQLKQRLEEAGVKDEVRLRWKRQPDGKVFHREEEETTASPADQEEEVTCDQLYEEPGMK